MRGERDGCGGGVAGRRDVAADQHVFGQLELLGELVDDAHVRLVRDERGEVVGRDARGVEGLPWRPSPSPTPPSGRRSGRPGASSASGLTPSRYSSKVAFMPTASALRAVGAPHCRADAGLVAGPITAAPAPSPSRNEIERSSGSHVLRELLGTDDEHVLGRAGADEGVGLGDRVGVAGAGRADVVRRRGVRADPLGEHAPTSRASDRDVADRRDQHERRSVSAGMPEFVDRFAGGVSARSIARAPLLDARRARRSMPVRCRIHSSDESIGPTSSSFGTTQVAARGTESRGCACRRSPWLCLRVVIRRLLLRCR